MGARKDISGQRFGRLVAGEPIRSEKDKGIIWRCECDCGGKKEVPLARLMQGRVKSCGCLSKEGRASADIAGQRFNRLVAKEFSFRDGKHIAHWLFKCDCGNEKVLPAPSVKCGSVKSCGCLAREHIEKLKRGDLSGQRFGRLMAVRPTNERGPSGSIIWKCLCDCGNIAYCSTTMLKSGGVRSCGCLYKDTRKEAVHFRKDLVEDTSLGTLASTKEVRSDNKSGCTGVYLDKKTNKWIACIEFQKRRYYLGSFQDLYRAVEARKAAERHLHDPIVREMWGNMSPNAQRKYLDYLERQEK